MAEPDARPAANTTPSGAAAERPAPEETEPRLTRPDPGPAPPPEADACATSCADYANKQA